MCGRMFFRRENKFAFGTNVLESLCVPELFSALFSSFHRSSRFQSAILLHFFYTPSPLHIQAFYTHTCPSSFAFLSFSSVGECPWAIVNLDLAQHSSNLLQLSSGRFSLIRVMPQASQRFTVHTRRWVFHRTSSTRSRKDICCILSSLRLEYAKKLTSYIGPKILGMWEFIFKVNLQVNHQFQLIDEVDSAYERDGQKTKTSTILL